MRNQQLNSNMAQKPQTNGAMDERVWISTSMAYYNTATFYSILYFTAFQIFNSNRDLDPSPPSKMRMNMLYYIISGHWVLILVSVSTRILLSYSHSHSYSPRRSNSIFLYISIFIHTFIDVLFHIPCMLSSLQAS